MQNEPTNLNTFKSTNIDPQFAVLIQDLTDYAKSLNSSRADFVKRTIIFSRKLRHQWNESRRLDDLQPNLTSLHKQHLLSQLKTVSTVSEASIESRYNTIAEQANVLEKYAEYIPPYREAIYELACAAKERQPIQNWINTGELTSESTVNEIKLLRGKAISEKMKRPKHYPFPVRFWFKDSASAAKVLSSIITSSDDFQLASDKAFNSALKTKQDVYAAYLKRVAA